MATSGSTMRLGQYRIEKKGYDLALSNTNLIAHEKALEAAGDAITLVMRFRLR